MSVSEATQKSRSLVSDLPPSESKDLVEFIRHQIGDELQNNPSISDFFKDQIIEQLRRVPSVELFSSLFEDSTANVDALLRLVEKTGDTPEDVLLKALTLYEVAFDATHEENQRLVLATHDYDFVREIVGLGKEEVETQDVETKAV